MSLREVGALGNSKLSQQLNDVDMYKQVITKITLAVVLNPPSFVSFHHHSVANTLRTSDEATVRSDLWGLRVAEGSLFKRSRVNLAPVKSQTIQCSNRTPSPSRYEDSVPNDQNRPPAEMRLYQSWRSPSWLHVYQLQRSRKIGVERENVSKFASLTDAVFRMACMGLVLAGLACLHFLYDKADRIARQQVQTASAHLKSKISIGRVIRCNPITGIRVKNLHVSKSSSRRIDPLGRASYIHASVSGYAGLILHKRPLEVSIIVTRGSLVFSDIVSREYGGEKLKVPNLEEPVQLLMRGWRSFPTLTSSPFSRLIKPGTLSFNHSQLRVECTQQGLLGETTHSVDVVNMSARLDLRNQRREDSNNEKQAEPSQAVIVANGSFRGGGHARVLVNVVDSVDDSSKASVSSVNASLKCSKMNIGSIASFFSLPIKLKDGTCTGSVELQLSPTKSYAPSISGQADVKSLGLRFDPSPESPELRNLTGKLRFRPSGVIFDYLEGELGSIPLEAKGHFDLNEGFNIESHARPFDVNRVIETFALNRFIPLEGSVIGKAVVRGSIDEPCVSGWIKAVGNRAVADRMLLKSAMMTYDWDAAAGNLLFPSMRATVVGGGELIGSGGIYFDMTQEPRNGNWNEKHHVRNPKAKYGNADERLNKTLPPLPSDDFEIDRWAPFRPYDSMDFEIKGSNVSGGNIIQWYGQKLGSAAVDAVGQIGGFCRIAGHAQDANSRLVWRAVRQNSSHTSVELPAIPSATNVQRIRAGSNLEEMKLNSDRNNQLLKAAGPPDSNIVSRNGSSTEQAMFSEEDRTEFLGGLIYMKLGDLPEARRIKARTTLKGFHVKRLISADPHFTHIILKAPNVIASMDTLFKGTVCMRPSWANNQAKKATLSIPHDLVSIDGGLAIRNLSLNGVVFRKIISGSLSLSATDVSLSLSESNLQNASHGPIQGDYQLSTIPPGSAVEMLEVKLNTKGFFHIYSKWDDSELYASMSLSDNKHRIVQLRLKGVDLQQLSGVSNPLLGNEHIQGILTTSIELDWTDKEGHMVLSVANLALGSVHFELLNGQLSLREGEISLYESILEHGLSKYKLEGKYFARESVSDSEWFINVNVDRAYVRDVSHLLDSGTKILTRDSERLFFANHGNENDSESGNLNFQSGNHSLNRGSSITYWEVPEELLFTEQTKWFNQSSTRTMEPDIAALLNCGWGRGNEPRSMLDFKNSLSGKITIYHPPRRSRDKQKRTIRNSHQSPVAALRNITLSFDLGGRDWTFHTTKIESVTVSGFMEDGSLSIHPFQIKGEDGLLLEGQGSFTNNGSLDGSLRLHRASVSKFDAFQRTGLEATGVVDGNLAIKGNISNPTFYGRLLWRNATVNGKIFSHPHADMVCSNGRCIINLDAIMTGKEGHHQTAFTDKNEVSAAGALQHTSDASGAAIKKVTVEDISSARRQDMDSVTARLSLPVRLLMRQWVLPMLSKGFPREGLVSFGQQHSFDDDWVFANVNVRRYGMVLLNGLLPDIGWIGGDSDLTFQLSGTKKNPELIGSVKVKNGHMHPSWMTQPIRSLTGEVELRDSGVMFCKALSGRCNGRAISIRGGMFLSSRYVELLEEKLRESQKTVKSLAEIRVSRELHMPLDEAESALRAGRGGIRVEVGGIPIEIPSNCKGIVSGKLLLTGTVLRPRVEGSLAFSEGIISANGALGDFGKHRTTSAQPTPSRQVASANEPSDKPFSVYIEKMTLSLGRNVRVVHSFLFNVFANGNISISGEAASPNLSGKIRIVSGNVSALPTRWTVRKSESSYVSFAHDPSRLAEDQEPTIKLVLENDTLILRVAECAVSSWMDNVSLSDKAGIRIQEKWWADAIHAKEDDSREGQKITKLLASLMINALAVGGSAGNYDMKLFPTYFGDAFPKVSRQLYEKYGAGMQLDHDNFCFESNVFADKWKGCQIMLKIARAISLHLFRDQSRQFANFELRLPGRT